MKRKTIIFSHIVFWLLSIAVETFPVFTWDNPIDIRDTLIEKSFMTFFCVLVFYTCYFFLARLLLKKRIFIFILAILAFVFLFTQLIMNFYPPILLSIVEPVPDINYTRWFFSLISYLFVFGLWGAMFRITISWFLGKQKQKELEKQNVYTELALLRSQINPHFLFNTLNNINSYIFRDPEKTSFGISKLSDIMSYMLYEANADQVKLSDEIKYISNYIELQKLRIREPDYISFDVAGNPLDQMIPPMLLIPFVENAFKHGRKNVEGTGIFITLIIEPGRLEFRVKNYLLSAKPVFEKNGGFGLRNIKRRLELIYGSNYSLTCGAQDDMYAVTLCIEKI